MGSKDGRARFKLSYPGPPLPGKSEATCPLEMVQIRVYPVVLNFSMFAEGCVL